LKSRFVRAGDGASWTKGLDDKHLKRISRRKSLLTVKMSPDIYVDFATACELRGLRPSSLVHHFAISVIREEQLRNPALFAAKRAEVKERIEAHSTAKKHERKKHSKGRIARVRILDEPEEAA